MKQSLNIKQLKQWKWNSNMVCLDFKYHQVSFLKKNENLVYNKQTPLRIVLKNI